MKRIIYLLLFSIFSGCSSVNQPISKEVISVNKQITENKVDTPKSVISATPKTDQQIKNELIHNNSTSEKPRFDTIKPVSSGIRKSYITVFFKDSEKIRVIGLGEKSFKSLTNKDTVKLNSVISKYVSSIEANEALFTKSEDELEIEEKASEKFYGIDYPNKGSIYTLYVENADVKAFIEELRKNEYVLSANENTG